ncbi:MAG: hypothetical protein WCC45_12390 [Paeniglutamicibacter sp.]
MDNIEKLISGIDPAERDNIDDPGPLQLQDPVPVFSQRPVQVNPGNSWGKWRILAAVTAVAAAAVGLVVWAPWQAPTGTGPASPTLPTTGNPTTGPSPSSSADGSALPRIDYGLPNFLVPASQDVYFQDSAACNALDLRTLDLVDANGIRTKLPDNANAYPVIGCVDSLATILRSDLAEAGNPTGDGSGIWLARWKDGTWSIRADDDTGINVVGSMPFFTNPRLRALDNPSDPILKPEQLRKLKVLGLDGTSLGRLLGPDVPSWMDAKPTEESHAFGNELLRMDQPAWEEREWKMDEIGTPINDPMAGPNDVDRYDLVFYDLRGKKVFSLTSMRKGAEQEPTDCADPGPTYKLDGESPSSVVADAGPLKLALSTVTEADGSRYSVVGLYPADLPSTGRACDVRFGVDIGERTLMLTHWNDPMGFKNQGEINAYLGSGEYTQAKAVAKSLVIQDLG